MTAFERPSHESTRVIMNAAKMAKYCGRPQFRLDDLFAGLVAETEGPVSQVFISVGLPADRLDMVRVIIAGDGTSSSPREGGISPNDNAMRVLDRAYSILLRRGTRNRPEYIMQALLEFARDRGDKNLENVIEHFGLRADRLLELLEAEVEANASS